MESVNEKLRGKEIKRCAIQIAIVIMIDIPSMSFGLVMGWISLASGEGKAGGGVDGSEAVMAAVVTFVASLAGVPVSAWLLTLGRKPAIVVTSMSFVVCWILKLAGDGWWLILARTAAGFGGAGVWSVSPILVREMCDTKIRGAAVSSLVLAHNLGFLIMYAVADFGLAHRTVLWLCLCLSLVHCFAFMYIPESPSFLAANGKEKEARASLAWLRGLTVDDQTILDEIEELPATDEVLSSPVKLTKEMLSDARRKKAFIITAVVVIGQEMSGVLTLLQFAERVFILARNGGGFKEISPSRLALILGLIQLIGSALALYLVERVGRRPLLVWGGFLAGSCLVLAGGAVCTKARSAAAILFLVVTIDSLSLQSAPYAVLGDMFHYKYRSCAVIWITAGSSIGNALESLVFPAIASAIGLGLTLLFAGGFALAYSAFAATFVPETKDKTPDEIYDAICKDSVEDNVIV